MMNQNGKTPLDDIKRTATLSLLDDLAKELDEGFIEDVFEIRGILWHMRLLQDHERNWANGYVRTTSVNAMITSVRAPTLAVGIRAIGKLTTDGKKDLMGIKDFFLQQWLKEKGELDPVAQRILDNANQYVQQYWFAERLFEWLSKRPPDFVNELWEKWSGLEKRREDAEKAMGKSSAEDGKQTQKQATPSSTTSSPTQPSTGDGNS